MTTSVSSIGATGQWSPLWTYARAWGLTGNRLRAEIERAGYRVIVIGGYPQVNDAEMAEFIKARVAAADEEKRAEEAAAQEKLVANKPPRIPKELADHLASQDAALEQLREQIALMRSTRGKK